LFFDRDVQIRIKIVFDKGMLGCIMIGSSGLFVRYPKRLSGRKLVVFDGFGSVVWIRIQLKIKSKKDVDSLGYLSIIVGLSRAATSPATLNKGLGL